MARYTGPKFRLDRAERTNLFLKGRRSLGPKHPLEKKGAVPPGMHGQKRTHVKRSEFGAQLREKQKVKRMYGVLEKQFKKYFAWAGKKKEDKGFSLLALLETRLDNAIYRLGLAASRNQARQMVTHGHVLVSEKKVNIPSYNIKPGDKMSLSGKMGKLWALKESEVSVPGWLERKGLSGKVIRLPEREEIDPTINEQLIVEYYSR